MKQSELTMVVFTDYSKAFDTIDVFYFDTKNAFTKLFYGLFILFFLLLNA